MNIIKFLKGFIIGFAIGYIIFLICFICFDGKIGSFFFSGIIDNFYLIKLKATLLFEDIVALIIYISPYGRLKNTSTIELFILSVFSVYVLIGTLCLFLFMKKVREYLLRFVISISHMFLIWYLLYFLSKWIVTLNFYVTVLAFVVISIMVLFEFMYVTLCLDEN